MRFNVAALAVIGSASAQSVAKGFNYGNTLSSGAGKTQSDFQAEFSRAQSLPGTSGFTSARLYTMIQAGTADTPISAIPAAIDTHTRLLLGLWASAGEASFQNEITALSSAITQYGTAFTDLIDGISVGSEDLYRISPTGIENNSGAGANPSDLVNYINQVRSAIDGTAASGASVGHVETWTAWVNGSNSDVITACDWLGMDAYPYFQNTLANGIDVANSTFFEAYDNTVGVAQGKQVWVTETGWPVSGPQENLAVANTDNARTYWQETGCTLFDNIPTWWYILQDALPDTPSPSFGIIGSDINSAPLFDLGCPAGFNGTSSSASSGASSATSIASSAASPTEPSTTAAASTHSIVQSPGPETSPSSASISQTSASAPEPSASAASSTASGTVVASAATDSASMAAGSAAGSSVSNAFVSTSDGASSASLPTASSSLIVYPITSKSQVVSAGHTSTYTMTTHVTYTSCAGGCPSTVKTYASAPSGVTANPAASAYGHATVPGVGSAASSSVSAGSASPSPASTSATAPAAPSGSNCPANLNGEYQYPHLIVPVSSANPDKAYGTSYNGTINNDISSVFNFDIPRSYEGRTCSLVFLLPDHADLQTSAYTFNGKGGITVSELSAAVDESTTYNSVPAAAVENLGAIESVKSGNSYVVASHECGAGKRQSFEFTSTGGLDLSFFEDYNPSPLGAYITVC